MSTQEKNDIKKSKGRPAIGQGEPVMLRLQPDILDLLDNFRRSEADLPTRQDAIRRILTDYLSSEK
ncbi:hypothetical protein GOZ93_00875 [Agrobacterium vitis]|uniref:hypothetical protein n=1 Tax=Agrobacterium vitis TaxID=373 RepID=UPI0012E822BE|nr:hypothetical protein [Agrobacterium vitis]MUZ80791.1 hypothetical protein [Agrobacterium vitis]MVA33665.1 hypothetical protein [Agrobacterium vitis]